MSKTRQVQKPVRALGLMKRVAALALLLWPATAWAQENTPPLIGAEEALMTDLQMIAEARGWTLEEAVAHHELAVAFGEIQNQVATKRPELYAGAALSDLPVGAPSLYIKGLPDEFVWNLVESAGFAIDVVAGQPFSWLELEERSIRLNHLIVELGFRNLATSFDERTGVVEATVTRQPGLVSTAEALMALLPAEYHGNTVLELSDDDVAIDHSSSFGGLWVRDDGVDKCTSGWPVTDDVSGTAASAAASAGLAKVVVTVDTPTTGVTTAGHCGGINQINHDGVGIHSLTHKGQHRGEWGDIEWHTSPQTEPACFFASDSDLRAVTAVEPRSSITVGESVCVYGRSSNSRDCSQTVDATSVSCTVSGVSNSRLVRMDSTATTIGGDSGGPWFVGTVAYGSVKGICGSNVFSVADLYDEALGVKVLTLD